MSKLIVWRLDTEPNIGTPVRSAVVGNYEFKLQRIRNNREYPWLGEAFLIGKKYTYIRKIALKFDSMNEGKEYLERRALELTPRTGEDSSD